MQLLYNSNKAENNYKASIPVHYADVMTKPDSAVKYYNLTIHYQKSVLSVSSFSYSFEKSILREHLKCSLYIFYIEL